MSEQKINNGGPAFPVSGIDRLSEHHDCQFTIQGGMTLRDYFAGQALMGIMAKDGGYDGKGNITWVDMTALKVYEIADAMIEVRNLEVI
jgi:hypothetical protein